MSDREGQANVSVERPPVASPPSVSPKPPLALPFFYGWVIVACVSVAGFLASGVTNVVFSVLLKPMTAETNWSRTDISAALGVGAIASGLLSPLAGWLADRLGGRVLLPLGSAISGVLYLIVAYATSFPVFLVSFAANRAAAWSIMSGVAGQATVASWFVFRRPRALGIVGMVGALGGSAMAVGAQFLLDQVGWRGVMLTYGVLTLVLAVVPSALLLRHRPEDVGLTLDGFSPEQAQAAGELRSRRTGNSGEEYNWTLRQAMRTPALWLVTMSGSIALFGVTGVSVHQIAYFTDQGIAPEAAASVLAIYTFSSAISTMVWGFLTERFDERTMSVGALSLAAGCIWFLTTVHSFWGAALFGLLFGACARGQNTLISIIFAQYYGRRNFGLISGFATPFQTLAAALGPVVAAQAFDRTGSYLGVFYILIGVFAVAAFCMFFARRPVPPTPASAEEQNMESHWIVLAARLHRIADALTGKLPEDLLADFRLSVDAGEPGIGLETLCMQLDDYDVAISRDMLDEIRDLIRIMELSDKYWQRLQVI